MKCNSCGYSDSKVVDTNKDHELNQIYRRRECTKCGNRFTTQEHLRYTFKRNPYQTKPPTKILPK